MSFISDSSKREESSRGAEKDNQYSSRQRPGSTSLMDPYIQPLADHEVSLVFASGDAGALSGAQLSSSTRQRTTGHGFLNTLRHITYRGRVRKQNPRKIFKRPLEISLPTDVVGNTPGAQSLLTKGSMPLEQQAGRLTKPPIVFSRASDAGGAAAGSDLPGAITSSTYHPATQLPQRRTSTRVTAPRTQLGRAGEALGSHPPHGELRTRTSDRRRHGRIFSQSQLTRTLASIDEEPAVDETENTRRQQPVNIPQIQVIDPGAPPLDDIPRLTVNHAWDKLLRRERSRYDHFVKRHSPAIELGDKLRAILGPFINAHSGEPWTEQLEAAVRFLVNEQQMRTEAADVVDSLEQFFQPLVKREEGSSWAGQLETLVRSLVHDQNEEAAAVIALNNLWLLLNPGVPHDENISLPNAVETMVRDMYDDFRQVAGTLDHIDDAVRPLVIEDSGDGSWFTQLEIAVQSLAADRVRVNTELAQLRTTAERSQRLAAFNQQKLQEAEKEIRRLRSVLDARVDDGYDMREYMPMALGGLRQRPVWPLK